MDIRYRFGVAIVEIAGRLVLGSSRSLRTALDELVVTRPDAVLINMAAVTQMDAHGIGELVYSFRTLERQDSQMALVAPSAWVRRLLAVTRLDTVFPIYNSEEEALLRIRPQSAAATITRNAVEPHVVRHLYV